ncbi:MAG: TolC family protein [Planctomycetota bacterium]
MIGSPLCALVLLLLPQGTTPEIPDVWHLGLEEARALALRGNLDLRVAEEAVQQAHFRHLGSFGAFEWRFNGDLTYRDATRETSSSFLSGGNLIESQTTSYNLRLQRPFETGATFDLSFLGSLETTNASIADSDKQTSDELALQYTQPLLRGRGGDVVTADKQQAAVRWEQEVETWRGSRQGILAQVDKAYWDLRAAVDAVEVRQSAVALGQALLERRRQELNAGVGTELAVIESEAELATRHEALLAAQNLRGQREDALKKLLLGGEDLQRWHRSIAPADGYPELDAMGSAPPWRAALAIALEARSELRRAQATVRLAEIDKARALSNELSGLDLVLRASSNAVDANFRRAFADTFDWEAPTYSAQLSYDVPLGNQSAKAEVQRTDSALRTAWVELEKVQRDVVAEVRGAVRELEYRREASGAADLSLELARRQLEQEEARNREGLSTNYQVLEVQQRFVEALSTQRQSRAEWAKAWVELKRSQGLIEPGTQVDAPPPPVEAPPPSAEDPVIEPAAGDSGGQGN